MNTTHQSNKQQRHVVVALPRGAHISLTLPRLATIRDLKLAIQEREGVPSEVQRIRHSCDNDEELLCDQLEFLSLEYRICGGKQGAFGQSLRGQHARPGAKRTTNFDSCRTLDGRRLRHVKKEQQLVSWYQEKIEQAKNNSQVKSEDPRKAKQIEALEKAKGTVTQWLQKEIAVQGSILDALEEGLSEEGRLKSAEAQRKAELAKLGEVEGSAKKRRRLWDDLEEELFAFEEIATCAVTQDKDEEKDELPPPPAEHKCHPHPLKLTKNIYNKEYATECDICGVQTFGKTYHCAECKWDSCQRCYSLFYEKKATKEEGEEKKTKDEGENKVEIGTTKIGEEQVTTTTTSATKSITTTTESTTSSTKS